MILTDDHQMEKIVLDCDKLNEIEMENISEREEGEISDLDFEDISDDDSSLMLGKSNNRVNNSKFQRVSPPLSLISDTDLDSNLSVNSDNEYQSPRRRYRYRRKKSVQSSKSSSKNTGHSNKIIKSIKSRRRKNSSHFNDRFYLNSNVDPSNDSKHITSYILSSDSEDDKQTVDRSMLKKLNKAICVDSLDQHTSLSTRLKNMINKSNGEKDGSSDSDYDLTALREMALQTKQKEKASTENKGELKEPRKSIDEAEQLRLDALRTAILKKHQARCERRMKQKIQIAEQKSESLVEAKSVLDSLIDNAIMQVELKSQPQTLDLPTDNNKENQHEPNPQTWEEDEDILRAKLLSSVAKKLSATQAPIVTKKVQPPSQKPAEIKKYLDAPVQRLIIKVDDSDSDSSSSSNSTINSHLQESLSQLFKNARAEAERKQKSETNVPKTSTQARQAEYLKLKQRLEFLSKNRNDLINNNQKLIKSNTAQTNDRLAKFPAAKKNINGNTFTKRKIINNPTDTKIAVKFPPKATIRKLVVPNKPNVTQTSQKRILDGKYLNLVPIVKKAKSAKLARDNAAAEVQRLMLQLQKAKERHIAFHQQYKNCVHEYVALKSAIDKTAISNLNLKKRNSPMSVLANESKRVKIKTEPSQVRVEETSSSDMKIEKVIVETSEPTVSGAEKKSEVESSSSGTASHQADIPNEDLHEKRNRIDSNPQIVICPFDLQGTCKDLECPYRHFGKCS